MAHRSLYRANPTTGISSTLSKVVHQRLGAVSIIPYTLGYPALIGDVLELINSDWNHFQHIWATQFHSRAGGGCEEEYTHTLALLPWTWLTQNNLGSCRVVWLVDTTSACDGELLIGWGRRVVVWLGSD